MKSSENQNKRKNVQRIKTLKTRFFVERPERFEGSEQPYYILSVFCVFAVWNFC